MSIAEPVITNDTFVACLKLDCVELPLNKREWYEQSTCPICKRLVYTYRHHRGLCTHICELTRKTQKSAQDAIKKANRLNQ
jgi:hypothetical protein